MMQPGPGANSLRGFDGHELEHNLILPQIALGDRYKTSVVILNMGNPEFMTWVSRDGLRVRGKIYFFSPDGSRLSVSVDGASPASEFGFVLEASQSRSLGLTAPGPDASAWALIEIEESEGSARWGFMDDHEMERGGRVMATVFYTFEDGGQTRSRVGVLPSLYERGLHFNTLLPVSYGIDLNTGVAIVNTGSAAATIELRLRDVQGAVFASRSLNLQAGNQTARFVDELFGIVMPLAMQGTLEVVTSSEGVVTMGLLIGQGIMTSIPTMHYGRARGMIP